VKIGIVIPTYNEAANIGTLIDKIHGYLHNLKDLQAVLLVVDDSSPDGTSTVVSKYQKKYRTENFKVTLLSRKAKDGFGRAYIAGFNEILKTQPDYILQMDADLSHNPKYLPAFVKAASKHDLVIGSRYVEGGGTPDWSLWRRLQSRGGNFYTRLVLGSKISDYTGGFNMFSKALLLRIDPKTIGNTGYGFLIDLKFRALKQADSVYQVPIVFHDRKHGKSKLPRSTIIKNLLLVPRLRMQSRD
jgi:dolichol-phosphate mannosyltransferase